MFVLKIQFLINMIKIILSRQKFKNKLKQKAEEYICERLSKLLYKELEIKDINTLASKDLNLIRKNNHYTRASLLPQCFNDVYNT